MLMGLVFAQDPAQVRQIPDERTVEQFTAAPSDPALHDRVHSRRPHGAAHGLDPGVGHDVLKLGRGHCPAPKPSSNSAH
jgi:hypothetical protein